MSTACSWAWGLGWTYKYSSPLKPQPPTLSFVQEALKCEQNSSHLPAGTLPPPFPSAPSAPARQLPICYLLLWCCCRPYIKARRSR